MLSYQEFVRIFFGHGNLDDDANNRRHMVA